MSNRKTIIHGRYFALTTIAETTLAAWKSGRKVRLNTKGWYSGNAVCCPHNGESQDIRGRGGMILSDNGGINYSCFNCNFTSGYVPGGYLGHKFRKLLKWLGVDDLDIHRLAITAMRERERQELLGIIKPDAPKVEVTFKRHSLPPESTSFMAMVEFYELKGTMCYPDDMVRAVDYVDKRRINMQRYDFYYSSDTSYKMNKRVIVPFTWNNEVIGYTARAYNDAITPKYQSSIDSGYVFNVDKQEKDWKFVIVCEGTFDALSIDAVAVLKSDVTQQQIDIIEGLDRDIIVVPDWNKSGANMIKVAVQNGWSVSFPVWAETCEDINQAVVKYGKLFVLKTILDSIEKSTLKIELMRRKFT